MGIVETRQNAAASIVRGYLYEQSAIKAAVEKYLKVT
jgi:hypothetical protein